MTAAVTELLALSLNDGPARGKDGEVGEGVVLVSRRENSSKRARYYFCYCEPRPNDERDHTRIAGLLFAICKAGDVERARAMGVR